MHAVMGLASSDRTGPGRTRRSRRSRGLEDSRTRGPEDPTEHEEKLGSCKGELMEGRIANRWLWYRRHCTWPPRFSLRLQSQSVPPTSSHQPSPAGSCQRSWSCETRPVEPIRSTRFCGGWRRVRLHETDLTASPALSSASSQHCRIGGHVCGKYGNTGCLRTCPFAQLPGPFAFLPSCLPKLPSGREVVSRVLQERPDDQGDGSLTANGAGKEHKGRKANGRDWNKQASRRAAAAELG